MQIPPVLTYAEPVEATLTAHSVEDWLKSIELEGCNTAIQEMGYTSLSFLREADHADVEAMIEELEMKRPQAK